MSDFPQRTDPPQRPAGGGPSPDYFRLLVDAAPNAIVVVNRAGQIALINAATEALLGYDRSELVGKPIEVLVPDRFRAGHVPLRDGFLAHPETRPMGAGRDLFARRRDGGEVPVEIGLSTVETPDGPLVLASIIDLTARKQAEDRFRLVVEAAPNAIVVVDPAGRILLVNAQTERVFGYRREELVGQPVEILVPARVRGAHVGDRSRFFADPRARPMGAGRELYGVRKDGSEVPVEIGLAPIETERGRIVLAAIVDITERKLSQEALARQANELARSNAELQQFAYVATHDLQEPLRAIASCAGILQHRFQDQIDPAADELLQHMIEGAGRMQTLLEDLLVFSRVRTHAAAPAPTDCGVLLDRVLLDLRVALAESGAEVTREGLPTVMADASQLRQLLQNLVSNALKFRDPGRPLRVHVSGQAVPGGWRLSVADNGIGIEPQYHERIFRIFQRLHTRREYPGTGIGLAICKRVAERHGGRAWVESELGVGTTFHVFLPRDPPRAEPA